MQSAGQVERIIVMRPGETAELAGYDVRFEGVSPAQGPNYTAQRAHLRRDRGRPAGRRARTPSGATSRSSGMPTTEAGIDTNLWRDLYFVLGDPAPDGGCAVRLYYNPLVLWIWGGAGDHGAGRPGLAHRPPPAGRRAAPGAPARPRHAAARA